MVQDLNNFPSVTQLQMTHYEWCGSVKGHRVTKTSKASQQCPVQFLLTD